MYTEERTSILNLKDNEKEGYVHFHCSLREDLYLNIYMVIDGNLSDHKWQNEGRKGKHLVYRF